MSHIVYASRYDQIEKTGPISVHVGGTDPSGTAYNRHRDRDREPYDFIFSFSRLDTWFGRSVMAGLRWSMSGTSTAACVRVSVCSVLGRLMLCSRGSRVLNRSLLTSHALPVPVSYHHCTRISPRLHTSVSAACALLLARKMARRRHSRPAC